MANLHTNTKEVLAVFLAVCSWAPYWRNKCICIQSDNMVTVAAINKGTSRNPFLMFCLRIMFLLSAIYNFHIKAQHIRGISNMVTDGISRLHEPDKWDQIGPFLQPSPLHLHLSQASFLFLLYRSSSLHRDSSSSGQ